MAATLSSTFFTQNFLLTTCYQTLRRSFNQPFVMISLKHRSHHHVTCSAKKKISFVDQILDYIEGGPKLRKWYGAPDLAPKDGPTEDEFSEEDEPRDAVLVADGDSEFGQMVTLSLIVKRARIKALVKSKQTAMEAFGSYVEAMTGESSSKSFPKKGLRGVRSIICLNEGFLSNVGSLKGVKHVILLSQLSVYEGSSGIQSVMTSGARKLAEQDESVLISSGIPYTIIRAGTLKNTPGSSQGFSFEKGSAEKGSLSKEGAALICVEALDVVPETGYIFEVVNGEERVSDWKECLTRLMQIAEQ